MSVTFYTTNHFWHHYHGSLDAEQTMRISGKGGARCLPAGKDCMMSWNTSGTSYLRKNPNLVSSKR